MNRKLFWMGYLLAVVAVVWIIWRQRKGEIERRLESMRQGAPFELGWRPEAETRRTATLAKPEQAPQVQKKEAAGRAPQSDKQTRDDLQAIRGIGPTFERRLQEAGITQYKQLAALSVDEIRERINLDSPLADVESWIEQARALSAS